MPRALLPPTLLLLSLLGSLSTPAPAAERPPEYWPPRWPPYWYGPPTYPYPTRPAPSSRSAPTTPTPLPAQPPAQITPPAQPSPSSATRATGDTTPPPEAAATPHAKALAAMHRGDYAIAYCAWRPLAERGDAEAQFSLGWMYHNGYGLAIDDGETLAWWRRAAEQGHADAAFALGMLLSQGDGTTAKDLGGAVEYYLKAVRAGHDDARLMLRTLLLDEGRKLTPVTAAWGEEEWRLLGEAAVITAARANARRGPGLKEPVVAALAKGDEVIELGREGRWVRVLIVKRSLGAWIHDSLVTQAEERP